VTTTRRGWRSELDPALLVFTIVVCGTFSVLAAPAAPLRTGDGYRETPASHQWTASATDRDSSSDSDGDNDDAAGALPAASPTLRADQGHADSPITVDLQVPAFLEQEGHSLRGPPQAGIAEPGCSLDRDIADRTSRSQEWTAGHSSDDSCDNDDDDKDDDEGAGALPAIATLLTADHGVAQLLIQTGFDASFFIASDGHSLRAPPR
jgi:hypothetical protein